VVGALRAEAGGAIPAGRYIVDFCAPARRLVVEVDGNCHVRRRAADVRRDAALFDPELKPDQPKRLANLCP
jgi:hypothetical protein